MGKPMLQPELRRTFCEGAPPLPLLAMASAVELLVLEVPPVPAPTRQPRESCPGDLGETVWLPLPAPPLAALPPRHMRQEGSSSSAGARRLPLPTAPPSGSPPPPPPASSAGAGGQSPPRVLLRGEACGEAVGCCCGPCLCDLVRALCATAAATEDEPQSVARADRTTGDPVAGARDEAASWTATAFAARTASKSVRKRRTSFSSLCRLASSLSLSTRARRTSSSSSTLIRSSSSVLAWYVSASTRACRSSSRRRTSSLALLASLPGLLASSSGALLLPWTSWQPALHLASSSKRRMMASFAASRRDCTTAEYGTTVARESSQTRGGREACRTDGWPAVEAHFSAGASRGSYTKL